MNKTPIKHFSINTWFDTKNKSSFCWKYFGDLVCLKNNVMTLEFPNKVFCNACLKKYQKENEDIPFELACIRCYSKTVSTGNLNRHLKETHKIFSSKKQQNIDIEMEDGSAPEVAATRSSSIKRNSWLLARDIALWYCKSLMPMDSVSDEGMTDFFQKYEIISESADMPSKVSITRTALDDIYESMMKNVRAQIAVDDFKHVAFGLDFWKNRLRQYITVSLFYLTDDFVLKSFTLCTKFYDAENSEESIRKSLNEIVDCFGLTEKEFHIVTNAELNGLSGYNNSSCLGQGLSKLIIVDGIHSILELFDFAKKCTQILSTMYDHLTDLERHAEDKKDDSLQAIQRVAENLEHDKNNPINDDEDENAESESKLTPTRWYIMLAIFESIARLGGIHNVNNIMAHIDRDDLEINKQEWKVLEDLIHFLRKIREVLEMLSAQNTSSLNLALVFHLEMKDILNSETDDEIMLLSTLKNNMLSKLNARFPITDKIIVAALLDPRFISLSLIDTYLQQRSTSRDAFLAEYVRTQTKIIFPSKTRITIKPETSSSSKKKSGLTKLLKKHSSDSSKLSVNMETDAVGQECSRYIRTANASDVDGEDILTYWRDRKNIFPILSELARDILAIPATSTTKERAYSEAGLAYTAKRSLLNPLHLNKMLFIHDNYLMINR